MDNIRIVSVKQMVAGLFEIGDDIAPFEADRQLRLCRFPHSVILEGAVPEYDFASRWCWQNFGACDGECYDSYSEYPACPVVLATKRIENVRDRQTKKFAVVDAHTHEGLWTKDGLGKTGYDYGFFEFYFASEADQNRFTAAVPTFIWGENFG
jgi:hypothetical protein